MPLGALVQKNLSWAITFETGQLFIVDIYIWLPLASHVVSLTTFVYLVTLTLKFNLLLKFFSLAWTFEYKSYSVLLITYGCCQ